MGDVLPRVYTTSLNDCLETGPNLLLQIIEIFVTFRCYRIGLIGDIEKAFLNVGVSLKDRDVLRFLWVNDVNHINPEVVMRLFSRVLFGSTASQFLLNVVVQKHIQTYNEIDPQFVKKVMNEIYVDDLISGEQDTASTYDFYKKCKDRCLDAGLDLRKRSTNDDVLRNNINTAEKLTQVKHEISGIKVLGVN